MSSPLGPASLPCRVYDAQAKIRVSDARVGTGRLPTPGSQAGSPPDSSRARPLQRSPRSSTLLGQIDPSLQVKQQVGIQDCSETGVLRRHVQISVPTALEDKSEGQANEDQGRRQRGYSVRRTRAQYRLDPSSHVNNSVPRIVSFVPLSPACSLGSLFKEHQGEETGGRERQQPPWFIFPLHSLLAHSSVGA